MTDNPKAHGDPFPPEEIAATKEILGLPADQTFWVPEEVIAYYREAGRQRAPRARLVGSATSKARLPPGSAARSPMGRAVARRGPGRVRAEAADVEGGREAGHPGRHEVLPQRRHRRSAWARVGRRRPHRQHRHRPRRGSTPVAGRPGGPRQFSYGVREHGMGGVMVGLSRHGGALPVGGTFFCFSDYMRGSVRLAALSKTKVIYSWTHDSVGLGEDGPTHQPVEQLAAMRAMPNLLVIRPADANETAQAVKAAIDHDDGPTALILTRQISPGTGGHGRAGRTAAPGRLRPLG